MRQKNGSPQEWFRAGSLFLFMYDDGGSMGTVAREITWAGLGLPLRGAAGLRPAEGCSCTTAHALCNVKDAKVTGYRVITVGFGLIDCPEVIFTIEIHGVGVSFRCQGLEGEGFCRVLEHMGGDAAISRLGCDGYAEDLRRVLRMKVQYEYAHWVFP